MGELQYPKIDGEYVSWAEIGISLETYGGKSFRTADFSALDWDHKLEPGRVEGTGPMHVGRTFGKYEANASMSMWIDSALAFQEALQDIDGKRYGTVKFDIMCSYEPLSAEGFAGSGRIITLKLVAARIAGEASKNAPGPDGTGIDMPLSIDRIEKILPNGKVLRLA